MKTPNPNACTPDFSHRVNAELDASPARLHDCLNPALERAAALADLMESAFEQGKADEISNLWRAAQAIRFEILDAQAILDAYYDGSTNTASNTASNVVEIKSQGDKP
ncbi:hypothetical protein [Methylovulum miyakonense]|uniref:hypothetical protein n=1 Tax=Methylovulum miyakonense TaxID=645578 RepID=UPI000374877A|nr:hypothetical protein [Methylovulum miyakonense]